MPVDPHNPGNPGSYDAYIESFRPTSSSVVATSTPAPPPLPPQAPPRSAPTTAAEARARIAEFVENKDLGAKLMAGDCVASQEYRDAQTFMRTHPVDKVDVAMSGIAPDLSTGIIPDAGMRLMENVTADLRERGLSDGAIRQTLAAEPVSAAEQRAAEIWKKDRLSNAEWVKRYQSGDSEAAREMTLCNIVLCSPTDGAPTPPGRAPSLGDLLAAGHRF